jgi:hypothetical protein
MTESEIKERLERTLHRRITQAEWRHLKRAGSDEEGIPSSDRLAHDAAANWREFKDFAADHLRWLRSYEEDKMREQYGQLEPEISPGPTPDQLPGGPSSLSDDRAFARGMALASFNQRQTGGRSSGRSAIHGTLLPRGGADGTLGQWVYIVAVELWAPAEEVARHYRRIQRAVLADPKPPKTSTRAFEVAAFVWDSERAHGGRLPWSELCERWNNWPLAEPFKSWQSFRRSFFRGAAATPPRYGAPNEQIADLVRERSHQGAFDAWASEVRE